MYTLGVRTPHSILRSSVKDMNPGDIGYIRTTDINNVKGLRQLVLRGDRCLIDLRNPYMTWTWGNGLRREPPPFEVELLQSGDVVTLIIK